MNIEGLKELFGDRLKENEPLAKHLNFKVGGPAKWFVDVRTVEELTQALDLIGDTPHFILGGGSNTLASDEGFDGVVLKLAMRSHTIDGTTVVADAGVISAALARATAEAGLAGFTWAISLPGTIGGAVRGNAGCFGGEMRDSVTKVEVLRDGTVVELLAEDLHFGYRESVFKTSDDIVLRVHLQLREGNVETLKQELQNNLDARKASQPLYAGSAGCIFKNYEFEGDDERQRLSHFQIPEAMLENRRVSAGWLIDQVGLKGEKIGQAQISEEHGNFIVNLGGATADHIVQLIALVKTRVRNEFNIQLHEEVKYLGF